MLKGMRRPGDTKGVKEEKETRRLMLRLESSVKDARECGHAQC